MTDLLDIEMAYANPRDIEEYENLTKQIELAETYEELMPLLNKRAAVRSRTLGAPLRLIKQ